VLTWYATETSVSWCQQGDARFQPRFGPVLRVPVTKGQFGNASSVHSWALLLDHGAVAQADFAPAAI
jgi:hypothetical protein